MTNQAVNRIAWIDCAKGIGIFLVVLGHAVRGLVSAKLLPGDNPYFQWFDFSLYTFHMPLFFFLSGLTVEGSLRKGRRQFMVGRFWTILYPYILWSLLVGSLLIPFSTGDIKPTDLLFIPIYPVSIFWFLYALLFCHVVFALWPKDNRLALLIASMALLVALQFVPPGTGKIWPPLFHFARFFPYYLAGYFLSGRVLKSGTNATAPLILAPFLAGAIIGAHALIGWEYTSIITLPAGLLGIGLIVSVAKLSRGRTTQLLTLLGTASMTIYVIHTVIGAAIRKLLLVGHIDNIVVHLIVGTFVAIVLPLLGHMILKHFGILHIFGLSAPPKPKAQPVSA